MATEKIERLISSEAIASFQDLRELVDANVVGFERLIAAGVELNTSLGKAKTFKEFNAEIAKLKDNEAALTVKVTELTAALEALRKKQSEGTSVTAQLEKAKKRLNDSYSTEARELSTVREQQILVNKANKQSAQETLGLVDAYRQLELEYNKAAKEAKNLTVQYGANSKEAKEAIALAQSFDARLKEADYSIGKYGRNVGNYGSALKTLESYLADVRTELQNTKAAAGTGLQISIPTGPASGAVRSGTGPIRGNDQATAQMVKYSNATKGATDRVAELSKQEELLSRIVNSQIAGFASATAEVKNNEKALQALQVAGLENTAFYKTLLKDTAELKDRVGDLKQEIKALSSDTRQFDLVAGAVTGLVSAFQVGASVAELYSSNNEEVQKSIQRLTALQNIAMGIQDIANQLTQKGTALNKLYNFVIGEGAKTRQVSTAATNVNTVATEANAIATEGAAVATTGLTTATKVLRGALLASGVGLLIVGITYLLSKLQEWKNADIELIKKQAELNQAALEQLRITKEIADLTRTDIGTYTQNLNVKLAGNQAYGRSQGEILAAEMKLLEARREGFNQDFFKTRGFAALSELEEGLNAAGKAYKQFIDEQARLGKDQKLPTEEFNARKDLLQSQLDIAKESYSRQREVVDNFVNNNREIDEKQLQIERLNADERRKMALETANISANAIIDANNRALNNERATMQQRLALIDSNIEQEKNKSRAAFESIKNDPSVSDKDEAIAKKQLTYELNRIEKDGQDAQHKIREDYRKRDSQAALASAQTQLDIFISKNEEIKNNEDKSLEDRLFAAYQNLQATEAVINAQARHELETAGLTATERKAIEDEANAKILEGRLQFSKDINTITLQNLQKQGDIRLAQADKEGSEAITKLNDQFAKGLITTKQYHEQRLQIENKYGALGIAIQIENIQKVIDYQKTQGRDVTQLEADMAAKRKEISDNLTAAQIENAEKLREKQIEVANELTDLFVSLDDASIEREQENIDREIEEIDARKQRETDFVNATIQDQQEKADALAVIDAKAQRDKEVLAERQKKLDADKARTDKIVAVARIVADTAQTVFRLTADAAAAKAQAALLLANPITAAYAPIAAASAVTIASQIPLVIGLGAIQAAKIIGAKAFRYGGTTDQNGTILVGDNWQSEYGITKAGTVFKTPAVPTLMSVEADTTIYPNKKSLEAGIMNSNYSAPILTNSDSHYKYMTEKLGGKIDRLNKTVKNKKETHIHLSKNGWEIMNNEAGQMSDYLTRNLRN